MSDENKIDGDGTGEFAIGFGAPTPRGDSVQIAERLQSAIADAEAAVLAAKQATSDRYEECMKECSDVINDCTACLSGSIDLHLGKAEQLIDGIRFNLNEAVDAKVDEVWQAIAMIPDDMQSKAPTSGHGIIVPPGGLTLPPVPPAPTATCPPGTHESFTFTPDNDVTSTCVTDTLATPTTATVPVTLPPAPPAGSDSPTTSAAHCMVEPVPSPVACTISRCRTECEAAGGKFKQDDATGQWVCHWPNGNVTACGGVDDADRTCFNSYGDCLNWLQYAGVYGWELFQPDPANPDHYGVRNANTGEEIFCEGQSKACGKVWPKRGPCPKPPDAPAASWLICREDLLATWMDAFGNVYGELCDVSECPPNGDEYDFWRFDLVWVQFQDGRTAWVDSSNNRRVPLCPEKQDEISEPTLDNAEEWIDQQDNPDDWSVQWDENVGAFALVDSVSGGSVSLGGQSDSSGEGTDGEEPVESDPVFNPALSFGDDEFMFAGRS